MSRNEEIEKMAHKFFNGEDSKRVLSRSAFVAGAKWADRHSCGAWIPVEEELPPYDEIVFVRAVYTRGIYEGDTHVAVNVRKEEKANFQTDKNGFGMGRLMPSGTEITHWMPIPDVG